MNSSLQGNKEGVDHGYQEEGIGFGSQQQKNYTKVQTKAAKLA